MGQAVTQFAVEQGFGLIGFFADEGNRFVMTCQFQNKPGSGRGHFFAGDVSNNHPGHLWLLG